MNLTKYIILLFMTICIVSAKRDRVRLKDVETLTLYSDRWTTSRRSAPVKQLSCVGGYCNRATVQSAQCYNRGFDGNDVQWECKADLPTNYKFGRMEVSCEGYEYPDDDYILTGSCGLEYTIDEISKINNYGKDSGNGFGTIVVIIFIGLAAALYFYHRSSNGAPPNAGPNRSWFSSSAPPPPGFRPDYCSASGTSGTSGTSDGTTGGPGFFSGMGLGSILGYMFGSRGNNGYGYGRRRGYHDSSYWSTPDTSGYSSFGGSSYSSGRSSSASTTTTSTGFASTKRR